jgi:DNA-binding transcriptional LysR family regulator
MKFRSYDKLKIFNTVARHGSFSAASETLNLTKGAVSHQIRLLESELGFSLFHRLPRGVELTSTGQDLLTTSQAAFESIDHRITELRRIGSRTLTIGVTTYFASRWLSPRLMDFMRLHPDIRLSIQPMIDLLNLKNEGVDLTIRWGSGEWTDIEIEPLFNCPAWPSGNQQAYDLVQKKGIEKALESFTLLRDREDSHAWSYWHAAAAIPYWKRADTLIIPDPNVRVQAVIDGQGIALNDDLIEPEIQAGKLFRLSPIELKDYGYYLATPAGVTANPDAEVFADWLRQTLRN